MKATITDMGILVLIPETETEAFAAKVWRSAHGGSETISTTGISVAENWQQEADHAE